MFDIEACNWYPVSMLQNFKPFEKKNKFKSLDRGLCHNEMLAIVLCSEFLYTFESVWISTDIVVIISLWKFINYCVCAAELENIQNCVLNIRSMTMVGINWSLVVIVACGYICLHLKNQLSKICISDCQKHMKHWINWLIVNRFEPVPFPVASSTLLWWEVVMVMLVMLVVVAVGGVNASNEIEWCIAKCLHFR